MLCDLTFIVLIYCDRSSPCFCPTCLYAVPCHISNKRNYFDSAQSFRGRSF